MKPTIALSQLLPALTLERSASKPGLRHNRRVVAVLAAKFRPRSTQALGQSKRPAEPKRQTEVRIRLKRMGTNLRSSGTCVASPIAIFYATFGADFPVSGEKVLRKLPRGAESPAAAGLG